MTSDRLETQKRRRELHEQLRTLAFAPLMRGNVYERLRKCGRKSCACARDPKARHRSHFLSVFLDGRSVGFHVRPVDLERVRAATAAYAQLWEIVNGLTACEVADLRREARERRRERARQC
jgi:hypothetical protein